VAAHHRIAAEFGDLANQFLAGVILRVGFAGEDQLHGTILVSKNPP
jgi:hypothetical protein